jgi:RNA polymerase sigma factor (sigma-70 family)
MASSRRTAQLLAAAQAGDREALEALCVSFYPRVLRIAEVRLGRHLRRVYEPTDIAQSVFGRAYRALPRFIDRGPGSFGGWLEEIVGKTILEKARWLAAARRREGPPESGARPEGDPGRNSRTPSQLVAMREDVERLHEAMRKLDQRDRRAVELRQFLGLPWSEVGGALGTTEEAARKICGRALERIGRALSEA